MTEPVPALTPFPASTSQTENPVISVCLTTYNHAPFIAQAIESVLAQQLNVSWELLIADDCSTDGTAAVAASYASRFPERIRYRTNEHNRGGVSNWLHALDSAHGSFIAHLDGDDYWTDPLKLQKQLDLLQQHAECSLCYTNAVLLSDLPHKQGLYLNGSIRPVHHYDQILRQWRVPLLSSSMWRRQAMPKPWPEWLWQSLFPDVGFFALLSLKGPFCFLNEPTVAYRIHSASWLHAKGTHVEKCLNVLDLLDRLDKLFAYRYRHLFNAHRADQYELLACHYLEKGNPLRFARYLARSLWYHPLRSPSALRRGYFRFKHAAKMLLMPSQ
ncbi:MAG: glycosyltransferase [Chitinophagales bacterium]|nr:glycosyltransferase [Chitinophagales bacterium]MDW8394370.1 glycosyltransferase [Chitinophagales bacterium]